MTAAPASDAAVDWQAPQRLHPAYFVTGLGKAARGSFGLIAAGAYFGLSGRWWLLGAMVILYAAVTLTSLGLRWAHFSYRVTDEDIIIESGLISTQHRAIPFERIQDVNIEQGPVARMLGIARVTLETGAASSGASEEGVLEAVSLPRAAALRDLIRAHRSGAALPGRPPTETAWDGERTLFAMAPRRVVEAGLYNFSLAFFAVIGGILQQAGDLLGFNPFKRAFWNSLIDSGSPLADYLLAHRWVSALAGFAALLVVGLATGIVRTLLRDYGFRLTRTETGLRRRRGLLTLSDVIIPVRRVQAAVVGTGPIRARAGWHSLKLQSLARDEAKQGDHDVAPFAQIDEIAPILAEVGMALPSDDTAWQRVASAYAIEYALWLALPLAGTLNLAAFGVLPALFGSAAIGIAMIGRALAWRRYRYGYDGVRILIRRGFWRQRTIILPITNIQSADIAHNFVTRAFGVAALTFGVAGGSGFSHHQIAALPLATAYALRKDLLQRAA
jgi:putative membrane protein